MFLTLFLNTFCSSTRVKWGISNIEVAHNNNDDNNTNNNTKEVAHNNYNNNTDNNTNRSTKIHV